tara:strand:+ start:2230 stop:2367 length:138 start_codon:yes stop_codon:yes gene_type:complete
MTEDAIQRLGNDVADIAYKLSFLEEEIARLNAHIEDLKETNKGEI